MSRSVRDASNGPVEMGEGKKQAGGMKNWLKYTVILRVVRPTPSGLPFHGILPGGSGHGGVFISGS